MKELVILRHAKSNRTYRVDDIHRPLLEQGIARIEEVAHQKSSFFQDADIILSSPANRALHTAIIMMHELRIPFENLRVDRYLYTFSGASVVDYIYGLDDRWSKVVLVGHNPAFTEVINHFSSPGINHLRTAGLAKITFEEELWHELSRGELELGQKRKQ